jgi:hypothetical protein
MPLQSVAFAGQAQRPLAHVLPPVQTAPQAPQWLLLLCRSTHALLQQAACAPPAPRQGLLQRPQCSSSDCRSTHTPPQSVWPAGQSRTQAPRAQSVPAAHGFPQRPQFCLSDCVSMQTPLQHRRPAAHGAPQAPQWLSWLWVSTHAPAQHVCSCSHSRPQAPQCRGAVCVLTQTSLQSVCPAGQVQTPLTHRFPPRQARLQALQ